jgi:phosphotriesterase-related protein
MATIETVSGPIDGGELGLTLAHEHLRSSSEAVREQFPHLYDPEAERAAAIAEVRRAMEHGVRTIVDPACMDLGRDVALARDVVAETGIQLVMCTGVYGAQYTFLPQHLANRDIDYLADAFVHDIEVGIQGTEVKAAFLKCAVDEPGVTEHIEKVLRAAARASLRTGRPIMAHSHPATRRGLEIMDVFDSEGVDPGKVQIAHTGDTDDLSYIEELLARGPFIGMDRYGLDIILPTARRNATVAELCERGYAERMTISQDSVAAFDWFPEEMRSMVPNWHMAFLWEGVLPELRQAGASESAIETMLTENPARWLGA